MMIGALLWRCNIIQRIVAEMFINIVKIKSQLQLKGSEKNKKRSLRTFTDGADNFG
jgi:hypothetical protein